MYGESFQIWGEKIALHKRCVQKFQKTIIKNNINVNIQRGSNKSAPQKIYKDAEEMFSFLTCSVTVFIYYFESHFRATLDMPKTAFYILRFLNKM